MSSIGNGAARASGTLHLKTERRVMNGNGHGNSSDHHDNGADGFLNPNIPSIPLTQV